MEKERFKAREVQPTALRLQPDVRAELVRLAFVNGRSLSKEIAMRLEASLKAEGSSTTSSRPSTYSAPNTPTVLHTANDKGPASTLSGTDQAMLDVFRALPPEKQLALLSLFR